MAAVNTSEPGVATSAQTETESHAQNGSAPVEGTGVQSEKAKAKAEAKAKAKAEKEAKKAANVSMQDLLCCLPQPCRTVRLSLLHRLQHEDRSKLPRPNLMRVTLSKTNTVTLTASRVSKSPSASGHVLKLWTRAWNPSRCSIL